LTINVLAIGGGGGGGGGSGRSSFAGYFTGGGGGGSGNSGYGASTPGTGGAGGGGNGGGTLANGNAGTANTGGGGGGSGQSSSTGSGAAGGSGVVIVSYAGSQRFTGGTVTSSGGNTIHTFTSSGVLTGVFSDYSPQGNNWTGNNISLTTGSTYDSMTDVPTLTSATAANYCVINPLLRGTGTPGTDFTYKNGNLTFTATAGEQWVGADGSIGVSSGKWYYEAIATSFDATVVFGWVMTQTPRHPGTGAFGAAQSDTGIGFSSDTSVYTQGSGTSLTNSGFTTNDVIGLAIDIGARTMTLYKNGTAIGGASTITSGTYWAGIGGYRNFNINVNFGQQPFVYTAPSGYLALNTYNI
jgi:hypothetical protein